MNRWGNWWMAIKDVVLTGTGIAVIFSQVLSSRPSDVILVTGLALTVPSVAGHATVLLSGRTGEQSSRSSSPSGSLRSHAPREEPGNADE